MIVRSSLGHAYFGEPALFCLGKCLEDGDLGKDRILVSWLVPPLSVSVNFKPGHKKQVVDLFGSWRLLDSLTPQEVKGTRLPDNMVSGSSILETNLVFLDGRLQYKTLCRLKEVHNIDVTALSVSLTRLGNAFRAFVLSGGVA